MLRSMTGFGSAQLSLDGRAFTVEARSVNNRFCDVRFHIPSELLTLQPKLEAAAREQVSRGRVDVSIKAARESGSSPTYVPDLDLAQNYLSASREMAQKLDLSPLDSVKELLGIPGILKAEEVKLDLEISGEQFVGALNQALEQLKQMRAVEGEALSKQLTSHLQILRGFREKLIELAPEAVKARAERLRQRVQELGEGVEIDPQRLVQEVAILADKADITEELERLESHFDQFETLLSSSKPAGRKMDFLLQEMNREANTVGSKASDTGLAHLIVETKAELERVREQVQNIE